ncbi:MAG TPA: SgcJ/EcaC family oxidoreductase [Alphaproteobacteria bacterium]|nr:SgcJ/EcaC family oxidoreductase [Alphaproteobacteria bacterium]
MRKRIWVWAVLAMVSPAAANAGPADDANALLDSWVAAFNANDAKAVTALYTPDAILLGTSSPVISQGTEQIFQYFARLPNSGTQVRVNERHLLVLDDDSVIATGFYDYEVVQGGRAVLAPARFTMVMVKHGDRWLIAHEHSSQRPSATHQSGGG